MCSTCQCAEVRMRSARSEHGIGLQAWIRVMAWYLEKRQHLESEVRKYSEPPSDALLPDLPPQAKCADPHSSAALATHSIGLGW